MSEWWSYTLADLLMFSARTYYRLFELQNRALWPLHPLMAAIGLGILAAPLRGSRPARRAALALLGLCWLWVGWAYHAQRYAAIHSAALYFAAAFALQGLLLLGIAVRRPREPVEPAASRGAGLALLVFGLLVFPLLAPLSGRPWSQAEVFGLAPDPTAIATLGALLALRRTGWVAWPVPVLWCLVSGATLWTMDAPFALVVPGAALLALLAAARKRVAGRVGS